MSRMDPNSLEWKKKAQDLKDNGVWKWFTDLRQVSTVKTNNADIGHCYALLVVEEWLKRKRSGEPVVLPDGVDIEKVGTGFIDMKKFKDAESDYRRDAMWVYMHLGADVDPESAPCSGAYFWLTELRANEDARKSFMINIMPKLMKDEDDNPMRDDGREQFEILERLTAETPAVG